MNFDSLEKEISDLIIGLPQIAKYKDFKSDSDWTFYVKNEIGRLGEKKGFNISASGIKRYSPEWLFDLVWYKNNEQGYLINLPLVLESEWKMKYKEIAYDFEKLLVSNAKLRVMIFQGKNKDIIFEHFSKLEDQVSCYSETRLNDKFLLLAYDHDSEIFHKKLIIV